MAITNSQIQVSSRNQKAVEIYEDIHMAMKSKIFAKNS
jgi:hypothetical protein